MARITVEDCIDKFPSRFELVLVASQRARKLHSGDSTEIEKDNDKNTVISLREIAEGAFTPEEMKENLIQEYQTFTISDEEEKNLELEMSENEILENSKVSDSKDFSNEVEKELNELVSTEESEIAEQYEITENIDSVDNNSISEDENQDNTETL